MKGDVTGSSISNSLTDTPFLPGTPHQEEIPAIFMPHGFAHHFVRSLVLPAFKSPPRASALDGRDGPSSR